MQFHSCTNYKDNYSVWTYFCMIKFILASITIGFEKLVFALAGWRHL